MAKDELAAPHRLHDARVAAEKVTSRLGTPGVRRHEQVRLVVGPDERGLELRYSESSRDRAGVVGELHDA